MPAVAPPPYPIPEPVVSQCVATASRTYGVPELVIRSILKVEGGQVGTMSRNTNGSFDLGPMQINTINLKIINKEYPFLTWRHITYNPCVNIMVGTWFLKSKIRNRGGVIWEGAPASSRDFAERLVRGPEDRFWHRFLAPAIGSLGSAGLVDGPDRQRYVGRDRFG